MALADRVKALRAEHDWSQTDLAARIGAAPAHVSRYESGRTAPSADTVIRLAETFGVSCDYLLVDDAPAAPSAPPRTGAFVKGNARSERKLGPDDLLPVAGALAAPAHAEAGDDGQPAPALILRAGLPGLNVEGAAVPRLDHQRRLTRQQA